MQTKPKSKSSVTHRLESIGEGDAAQPVIVFNVLNVGESRVFGPFSATQGPFTLQGGVYMFTGMGTFNGGSIAIQQICADGSTGETPTNLRSISANLSAQGSNCGIFLPAGSFQIAVIGSPSNMRAAITKIPVNNVSESFVQPSLIRAYRHAK